MEAIVLAGGFGTRLAHIVSDVPKPMAPVCGKPFLQYILDDLARQKVTRVILAVGYKAECIETFFVGSYRGMELVYSLEDKPLLTGGAIKKALAMCREPNVFILNGDTFFQVPFQKMAKAHCRQEALLTVAVKKMTHFDRYGTVQLAESNLIQGFTEKQPCEAGLINGGVYLLQRSALNFISAEAFSFETDFMEKQVEKERFYAFLSEGYFIDIGVPEDYAKAQEDFKNDEKSSVF
ncbi:nucleotidyltransferase family protein [Pygmaiobacter massiliensis]|uniref:nucleotidyltransferase family protein n=1 Tax=Pygmaiobacter massiliensis TaxID=1917873 RepID=UPI002A83F436|nr:nucleotidyltransferase family protein [Pygmaiobacter massiliensis]MDY4784945.1 nucleotidyltransferase family protein [Pygmaiobacter massiliensis]